MANEFRIDYISQLRAFRELKVSNAQLTAGMVSVYYALLDINNQTQWSEEFDVDFGYIIALSKVDKTTYYKAMDFFVNNGIIAKHTKGLNAYTRAKVSLCLLYEKSTGKQEGIAPSITPSTPTSDHHYNKTLNNKLEKETIELQFNEFWNGYDKKTGKDKCSKKWKSLKESDREAILKTFLAYVKSTPDKKFRKDPFTYLNGSHWNDEVITQESKSTISPQGFKLGQKPAGSVYHG